MGPPGHKKLPGMQVHYIYHIHKDMGPHVIIFQFRCVQSHYHTHIKSSTWPCSRPLQAFCERIAQSKELHEFDHGTVTVQKSSLLPSVISSQRFYWKQGGFTVETTANQPRSGRQPKERLQGVQNY